VRASSHTGAGGLAFASLCAHLALSACTGGNAQIGDACVNTSDCDDHLQCLGQVCVDRCHTHVQCGDGYRCKRGGECEQVVSGVGELCDREIDCGPGQACMLEAEDYDDDGELIGSCMVQPPGDNVGSACDADEECRYGICALGRCTQLCRDRSDCPPQMECASIPRLLGDSAPHFSGCLAVGGVIDDDISMTSSSDVVRVPVPSTAESFALVAQVDDGDQLVGASRVVAPDGSMLYVEPSTTEQYYDNPIRYEPGLSVSTLLVPNTPSVELQPGVYQVTVTSRLPDGGPGTGSLRLRVYYKLDTGADLDLHFHFLNLKSHPCADAFGEGGLDADAAQDSELFAEYLAVLQELFASSGVHVGKITYDDILDHEELDGIERDAAGPLFALAAGDTGIDVFFVRSIAPAGVQAVVGGTPGPPRSPGSRASGVAIGVDTLCYRSWPDLARITAHALARQMGLYYNRDPQGHADTIADSDERSNNLMFFGDLGGAALSDGQREVLRRYPGLR
jgi:hypothetical protein